jgi:lipoprotein signal peptidase
MSDPVPAPAESPPAPTPSGPENAPEGDDRPTFLFFGVVAAISLVADVATKAWAEIVLANRPFEEPAIIVLEKHLNFVIAYNKGGAWGLLQDAHETVRRPFFFAVSVLAVLFIVRLLEARTRPARAHLGSAVGTRRRVG